MNPLVPVVWGVPEAFDQPALSCASPECHYEISSRHELKLAVCLAIGDTSRLEAARSVNHKDGGTLHDSCCWRKP